MKQNINYKTSKDVLRNFYKMNNIINHFDKDNEYLEQAFNEINDIWFSNLEHIENVKYLMIAEAPLWGQTKNYFYNPEAKFTQFFFKSDLEYILNEPIEDKTDFITKCNKMGLLIIDISPFALNPKDTIINYRTISKSKYLELVNNTIPAYFEKKIKVIAPKKAEYMKVFFRYVRLRKVFKSIIADTLINYNFITTKKDILEISNKAGGIDPTKFEKIINYTTKT